MITFVFSILMILIFGKILFFALRAAWGISKILLTVLFFPLILVGLVLKGLLAIAFPILLVIGIIAFLGLQD